MGNLLFATKSPPYVILWYFVTQLHSLIPWLISPAIGGVVGLLRYGYGGLLCSGTPAVLLRNIHNGDIIIGNGAYKWFKNTR